MVSGFSPIYKVASTVEDILWYYVYVWVISTARWFGLLRSLRCDHTLVGQVSQQNKKAAGPKVMWPVQERAIGSMYGIFTYIHHKNQAKPYIDPISISYLYVNTYLLGSCHCVSWFTSGGFITHEDLDAKITCGTNFFGELRWDVKSNMASFQVSQWSKIHVLRFHVL